MKKLKYVERRVCESEWHEEIELEKFQRCPRCNSVAYHWVKYDKIEIEDENGNKNNTKGNAQY